MAKAAQPRPRFPYLFLPDGWDTGWVAAKAAAGAAPAQLLFLGDSIQVGCLATDWKNSYPHLVRESLKAGLGGLHADYFTAWGYSGIAAAACPGTPPWSALNASAVDSGRVNAFGWHLNSYDTNAATAYYQQTFTSPDACTALELYYVDYISGTWNYSIDGGADVQVTNTNASSNTLSPVKRIQVTGLANATHTVAVGKQSVASCCMPLGVATYPSGLAGGGLSIARFCNGFAQLATDWAGTSSTQHPPIRPELLAGLVPNGGGGVGSTFGYPTQPHLLVLELGVNDCNSSQSQATFETALRRFIQAVRKGRANASILLHIVANPDADISDITSGFAPANWPTYMSSIYKYAQAYNCAILNTHAKWGETPAGQGFLVQANNVHPTNAGHADIAADLLKVL